MAERHKVRFPNRDDHDFRMYSAIVSPRRRANGDGDGKHKAVRRRFGFPEWADVQRLLSDKSLPLQVRAKLTPLLERAHQRWCEAFGRMSADRDRSQKPHPEPDHGQVDLSTKHTGPL